MALLIPGNFIAEARGAIGGVVYSRNRAGLYARNRSVPVQPNSARQQEQKNILTAVSQAWATLPTAGQRTAWNAYAAGTDRVNAVGEVFSWTGHQAFVAINAMRLTAGQTLQASPPTTPGTGPNVQINGTVIALGASLNITSLTGVTLTAAIDTITVRVSAPVAPGVTFFKGPYTLALAVPVSSATVFPIVVPLPVPVTAGAFLETATRYGTSGRKVGDIVRNRFSGV